MKRTGAIILAIGLVITILTGIDFVTTEKVLDLGKVEITHNKKHRPGWSPLIGVAVMAIGAGIFLFGKKEISK